MMFYFTRDGEVNVKMDQCIKKMIKSFPEKVVKVATTPAAYHLFYVYSTEKLSKEKESQFHTTNAKDLFL